MFQSADITRRLEPRNGLICIAQNIVVARICEELPAVHDLVQVLDSNGTGFLTGI